MKFDITANLGYNCRKQSGRFINIVHEATSSTTTRRRQDEITEGSFLADRNHRAAGWLQGTARADTYASAHRDPCASGSNAGATHSHASVGDPLSGAAHVYTGGGNSLSGATHAYASAGDSLPQRVGVPAADGGSSRFG